MFQFNALKLVPITEIDLSNREFELPVVTHQSLNWNPTETVLFSPIWVQEIKKGQYQLIDGFQVVDIAQKSSKVAELPAFVLGEDIKTTDIWQLRFKKRATENNLPLMQMVLKINALFKGGEKGDFEQVLKTALKDVGVPVSKLKIPESGTIQAKYETFKVFTDVNYLGYKEIFQLLAYDVAFLKQLSQLLSGMMLKGNKLTSLLTLLDELEKGFKVGIGMILNDRDVCAIIKEVPENHRYKALKQRLIEFRYPLLTEQRKEWEAAVKKCALPGALSVVCDPYFENDHLEFLLKIKSREKLLEVTGKLKYMADSGDIQQLFDII